MSDINFTIRYNSRKENWRVKLPLIGSTRGIDFWLVDPDTGDIKEFTTLPECFDVIEQWAVEYK